MNNKTRWEEDGKKRLTFCGTGVKLLIYCTIDVMASTPDSSNPPAILVMFNACWHVKKMSTPGSRI